MKLPILMILLIIVVSTWCSPPRRSSNENDSSEFGFHSRSVEDSSEEASGENSSKHNRRSLGEFFGKFVDHTPLKYIIPSRRYHCNQGERHEEHYHHRHYGHRHEYQSTPESVYTPNPATTSKQTLVPLKMVTTTMAFTTPSTTISTLVTTTPVTIASTQAPRFNDPDKELAVDIDLRFGETR